MFEFFVVVDNLLPGHGYGLAIIILSVIVLVLAAVLIFEEIRLRKIISDLEERLEEFEKDHPSAEEASRQENPLQEALHKLDAGAILNEKKGDVADVLRSPVVDTIPAPKEFKKEDDARMSKVAESAPASMSIKTNEESVVGEDAVAKTAIAQSDYKKKSVSPGLENPIREDVGVAPVGASTSVVADASLSGAPVLRKPYIKRQAPISSVAVGGNPVAPPSVVVPPVVASSAPSVSIRRPYVRKASKKSDTNPASPAVKVSDPQKPFANTAANVTVGRDSVSRYEVKKEMMKIRDTTKTGISPTHVMKRYEKRLLEDDLLPRALTGNKIESKEIEKKIKSLEHEKFIARKFKEGKYERGRIQDNIDYLKKTEKDFFGKK